MDGRGESGLEIRRILLLTRLRTSAKGMTMTQIARDAERVEGWRVSGTPISESVRLVLQSLIDDKLIAVKERFRISPRGREYLEDPLQWRINVGSLEEAERKLFWNNIYAIFDKAFARLRSKPQTST
jgi:hypothetical protein